MHRHGSCKVHRSPHRLNLLGCEQVVDSILLRGPYYITRCKGVRSRAVQAPGDIVWLAIVLSVMPIFRSVHFQQDVLFDAVMCRTSRIFRLEHNICTKSTSTMLNPGCSAASAQHPRLPPSHSLFVCLFVCFLVVINPKNPYFASRPGLEVNPLGVYPLGPRSSSCGLTKGKPPPRNTLRSNWG